MNSILSSASIEAKRLWRKNIVFLIPLVFIFFGISMPYLARYIQELVASSSRGPVSVQVADPQAIDALNMYLQNIQQMGTIAAISVVVTSMGWLTQTGSVIYYRTRTKRLASVTLPRVLVDWVLIAVSSVIGTATMWFVTKQILGELSFDEVAHSYWVSLTWMFLLTGVGFFVMTLTRGTVSALVISTAIVILIPILNQFTWMPDWSPTMLLKQDVPIESSVYIVSVLFTILFFAAGLLSLKLPRLKRD